MRHPAWRRDEDGGPFAAGPASAYSSRMSASATTHMPASAVPLGSVALHAVHRKPASPLAPDAAVFERFLGFCHRRRYPPRTEVFRPGDPAGTLYYVINGSVSIITEEDDGRELVLGYFGVGEFVGEMGLFIESDRREVILRTRVQTELAEISYERLYQLVARRGARGLDHPPTAA